MQDAGGVFECGSLPESGGGRPGCAPEDTAGAAAALKAVMLTESPGTASGAAQERDGAGGGVYLAGGGEQLRRGREGREAGPWTVALAHDWLNGMRGGVLHLDDHRISAGGLRCCSRPELVW